MLRNRKQRICFICAGLFYFYFLVKRRVSRNMPELARTTIGPGGRFSLLAITMPPNRLINPISELITV